MKSNLYIVWGINYAPELTGIAPYNTALCEFLQTRGHAVRMVTSFPYYPEWRKCDEDRARAFRTDVLNQVPVHRCWHYVPQKPSALKRVLHELSFVITSFLRVLTLPRPAAYVVVSPPLLLGAAAWLAGMLKFAPFVFHVQDLQPDAAASLGMVRPGLVLRSLYGMEALAYRAAARVSGISPGMVRAFRDKGVPGSKTVLFPNGMELPAPGSLPAPGRFRRRLGIGAHELLALYSGNLGVKHGIEILLQAAELLRQRSTRLVICGDGARRQVLEQQAREKGLANVLFMPLQPEAQYREMMVDADVYLVTQQPGSGALFFPSKLLKGLAFSKAIVVVADGHSELTRAANEGGFALVVGPRHPDKLASALEYLAGDPEKRQMLGGAGRKYVEQFEMERLLHAFEAQLGRLGQAPMPEAVPAAIPVHTSHPESESPR